MENTGSVGCNFLGILDWLLLSSMKTSSMEHTRPAESSDLLIGSLMASSLRFETLCRIMLFRYAKIPDYITYSHDHYERREKLLITGHIFSFLCSYIIAFNVVRLLGTMRARGLSLPSETKLSGAKHIVYWLNPWDNGRSNFRYGFRLNFNIDTDDILFFENLPGLPKYQSEIHSLLLLLRNFEFLNSLIK